MRIFYCAYVEKSVWWTATYYLAKNAVLAYKTKISLTQSDPVPRLASPHLSAKTSDSAVIQPQWVLSLIHRFVPPSGNHTTLFSHPSISGPFCSSYLIITVLSAFSICRFYFSVVCSKRNKCLGSLKLNTHTRAFFKNTDFYWGRTSTAVSI